jgi:putative transposase
LYREEGLSLRLKRRTKRPSHLRVVMTTPNAADESWAMDCVADALANGRRIRMLTIIDACNYECTHIELDFSLTGVRVARVLEQLCQQGRRTNLIQLITGRISSARRSTHGRTNMASNYRSAVRVSR